MTTRRNSQFGFTTLALIGLVACLSSACTGPRPSLVAGQKPTLDVLSTDNVGGPTFVPSPADVAGPDTTQLVVRDPGVPQPPVDTVPPTPTDPQGPRPVTKHVEPPHRMTPTLLAATADPAAGFVTLSFDRTVELTGAPNAVARLKSFGHDNTCSLQRGTADRVVSGERTDHITFAVGGLDDGTNYIAIEPKLVRDDDRAGNDAVDCTEVAVRRAPVLQDVSIDLEEGTVSLTFDRPVEPGSAELATMYLVVYGDDATCATPQGNGHTFLSGAGTRTVTVDATSLVRGTTYIALATGFVQHPDTAMPNRPEACRAIRAS